MGSTTFFGNRARSKLLNTWVGGTYTLTNGSLLFTGSASVGDYVWLDADGSQFAVRVASAGHLAYPYLGAGGTGNGYTCTPSTIAVTRGFEANVSWTNSDLYGTDSIFRQDEARSQLKVDTKLKYSKWDAGVTHDWMMSVLNPDAPDGTIENTNLQYTNAVVYTIVGSNMSSSLEIVCGRVYWEGLPNTIPENDFVIRDISGHAKGACFYG